MTSPDYTGYLVLLKGAVVDALQRAFDDTFITRDFRSVNVSIEYPLDRQSYPSLWVNYEDQDTLTIAAINHREFIQDDPNDPGSPFREVTRWMFSGEITITIAALTSMERDRLYDEFVRVFAFSRIERATNEFRAALEDNDFIALRVNWDQLRPHGDGAAPGTPWGTEDEVIYEKSVGFDVEGEFVSDPANAVLVPLGQIVVEGTNEDVPDETAFHIGVPRQF
jgi:hypothetical protein